jgi:hypothetical protein
LAASWSGVILAVGIVVSKATGVRGLFRHGARNPARQEKHPLHPISCISPISGRNSWHGGTSKTSKSTFMDTIMDTKEFKVNKRKGFLSIDKSLKIKEIRNCISKIPPNVPPLEN